MSNNNNYEHLTLENFMQELQRRNPHEVEYHQAVSEVAESIIPYIAAHPKYQKARILQRLTEPDRIHIFRVMWQDDEGNVRVNRGYRIQFSNAIGPYKGGLRFHPSVNLSILKFLAFEQIFKNSLTTLPLGAGKGGADFNPKGKSDGEIMRFCQSFMTELHNYIGANIDIPAGDIGVGRKEVSFLFGQYKKLSHSFEGVLTGKAIEYGGSLIRTEATGYGCVYFMTYMLAHAGHQLKGKKCIISGAGNVAVYCAEKLLQLGAKVVTLSDSSGYIYDEAGLDKEKIAYIKKLKFEQRGRLKEYAEKYACEYHEGKSIWHVPCDLAFPCATQNEIDQKDAEILAKNGCIALAEGANMPSTREAIAVYHQEGILYAPGKAANAGGVAVSGLEMSQNSLRLSWTSEEVDDKLKEIMQRIHSQCVAYSDNKKTVDYVQGANIAGFVKVAEAMLAYGIN